MREIPSRQVHLDFHTGKVPGIAEKFDKKEFQQALITGHVASVTVFGKCHHGYHYFPTKVGTIHPGLAAGRDFSGELMEACHEIGVYAPLYLTVGWSALDAEQHPEWIARDKNGAKMGCHYDFLAEPDTPRPEVSWAHLCTAGGYRDYLIAMTEEVCRRYERLDGIFFDIMFVYDACWCDACVKGMKAMGLNPADDEDAKRYYALQKTETINRLNAVLKSHHPEATVYYNSGGAEMHMPQWHFASTHFEMEDLPTVWGGYDKMPIRARYFARSGKPYVGQTGKFHRAWGEFGGYKTPEALTYECAAMLSCGARVLIGDQMHPDGHMDMDTYRHMGQAFSYAEQIEEYCLDTKETARLGVVVGLDPEKNHAVAKLLLDCHVDFDIVHDTADLARFDTVLLPDNTRLGEALAAALSDYLAAGGKLFLLGGSGLSEHADEFALPLPFTYEGRSAYDRDYFQVTGVAELPEAPVLCYSSAHHVRPDGEAKILSRLRDPYFSRTYGHYFSHFNTPYSDEEVPFPGAVRSGNVLYVAHELADLYQRYGNVYHRRYFHWLLRQLYRADAVRAEFPTQGRLHMTRREEQCQYVLHLLYASPVQRGEVAILEDFPTIRDIPVTLQVSEKVKEIRLMPEGTVLPFTREEGKTCFILPELTMHRMAVISYER